MVAPLIAAAASRLGPALRSAGGKWMHSTKKGVRQMGSKMLKVNDSKLTKTMAKYSDQALGLFKVMSKGVGKILGALAKHSPALRQQLIIMGKGLSVMIRPIGDIMAKFLRPMAVWVMKVAQKWYALFGTGGGDSEEAKEDAVDQAKKQLEGAILSRDPAAIAMAEQNLADAESNLAGDKPDKPGWLGTIWQDLVPAAFKDALSALGAVFSELWVIVVEVGKLLWDILGPGLKMTAGVIGGILIAALYAITFVLEGVAFILDLVGKGLETVRLAFEALIAWLQVGEDWIKVKLVQAWEWLVEKMKVAWEWIKTKLPEAWDTLKNAIVSVYDWIKNTFIGIWETLLSTIETMWSGVKNIIDKITFWKKPSSDDDEKDNKKSRKRKSISRAVGGLIPETGMYNLHAGERVLTAGDTSRSTSNSQSINVTNNIALNATINNDMDIEDLARRLAALSETELRRRVSYI